jgi:hypothetical protein
MELQHQAQQMTRNVQHHFAFHKSIEAKWLEDVDQYLRTTNISPINNSIVQDVVGWSFMRVTGPEVPQPAQFHLLKRHPLPCGIMIYHAIAVPGHPHSLPQHFGHRGDHSALT